MSHVDRYTRIEASVVAVTLAVFVLYFGIHCFRYTWVGDFHRHCAAVASLYTDFLRPPHEAMAFPGSASDVHTPYIVAVAGIGRLLNVRPYRALQLAGIFNLLLYAFGVCVFFRTFSAARRSWIPPIAFLVVSLFMRERGFDWASETSFSTVREIQAYPSFFAWGVALTIFAIAEQYFVYGRRVWLAAVGCLLAILLLSHVLTGAWVVEILGFGAGMKLVDRRDTNTRARVVAMCGVVIASVLVTWFWPYFDVLQARSLRALPEGSAFGDHPFHDMARMYLLAGVVAVWFLWHRAHGFLVGGFVVTFAALQLFRALDYSYGNRFAFFQAFFAQAIVADGIAVGVLLVFHQEQRRVPDLAFGKIARAAFPAFAALAVVLSATAPIIRSEAKAGRPLLGIRTLLANTPADDAYYGSLDGLGSRVTRDDIVLMPVDTLAWDVASITGARVVVSLFAYRVTDYARRIEDVERFLSPGADLAIRRQILKRYNVSKILLTASYRSLTNELSSFGTPVVLGPDLVLISVR